VVVGISTGELYPVILEDLIIGESNTKKKGNCTEQCNEYANQ